MKNRTYSKHLAQGRKLFYDSIAHYNSKIRHCKRWRNRRKAGKLFDAIWHKYKKQFS